jgi:DNA recombination protein RmuC
VNPLLYALIGLIAGAGVVAIILVFGRNRRRSLAINSAPLEQILFERVETLERRLGDEFSRNREESASSAKAQREELAGALKNVSDTTLKSLTELSGMLRAQLDQVTGQARRLTDNVDSRLKELREENTGQLEKMRATVDEKLQGTLEKRLGEAFKQVTDNLTRVYEVSGEMKTLAMGVGDLKRILSNVTTRGNWGEAQLETLLTQLLTPEQFQRRVRVDITSGEMVDFAIKLPGAGNDDSDVVWLPIDAKFPTEDYQRLVEAQEKVDTVAAEAAAKMLANRLRDSAKEICAKYIRPPRTTDFAIMFLPTEGLYAEMIRRAGLFEIIQRDCRVLITGPITLAALLNSLQMGFRSLTIQKRSSEVWQLLKVIKLEFGKFGDLLDGVKKKLDQASNTMEDAARKSRTIERRLEKVQELPVADANVLLKDIVPDVDQEELL